MDLLAILSVNKMLKLYTSNILDYFVCTVIVNANYNNKKFTQTYTYDATLHFIAISILRWLTTLDQGLNQNVDVFSFLSLIKNTRCLYLFFPLRYV